MRPDGGSSPRVEQDLGQEQGHRPLPGAPGSDRESLQPVLLAALESAAGTLRQWRHQSWSGRRLAERAGLDLDEAERVATLDDEVQLRSPCRDPLSAHPPAARAQLACRQALAEHPELLAAQPQRPAPAEGVLRAQGAEAGAASHGGAPSGEAADDSSCLLPRPPRGNVGEPHHGHRGCNGRAELTPQCGGLLVRTGFGCGSRAPVAGGPAVPAAVSRSTRLRWAARPRSRAPGPRHG